VNNGGCQQVCINIPGERLCDCKSGFSLKENSQTECEGKRFGIEKYCNRVHGALQLKMVIFNTIEISNFRLQ
jgi:hypothetical protein